VNLLDVKIEMVFNLLNTLPFEEAICVLENVKIQFETHAVIQEELATAAAEEEVL